jgi:hypothetical protein
VLSRIRDVVDEETFENIVLTDRGLAGDVGAALEWLYRNIPEWRPTIDEARAAEGERG